MIKLQVIGHLGKDATVNTVGGNSVINFSVCHSEKFKDRDGNMQTKSTWVECAKWGDKIAVAQWLKKGGQVFVEGVPEVKTFDKKDGTTGTSLTLRVFDLQLLGSGGGNGQANGEAHTEKSDSIEQTPQQKAAEAAPPSDDLPF